MARKLGQIVRTSVASWNVLNCVIMAVESVRRCGDFHKYE